MLANAWQGVNRMICSAYAIVLLSDLFETMNDCFNLRAARGLHLSNCLSMDHSTGRC